MIDCAFFLLTKKIYFFICIGCVYCLEFLENSMVLDRKLGAFYALKNFMFFNSKLENVWIELKLLWPCRALLLLNRTPTHSFNFPPHSCVIHDWWSFCALSSRCWDDQLSSAFIRDIASPSFSPCFCWSIMRNGFLFPSFDLFVASVLDLAIEESIPESIRWFKGQASIYWIFHRFYFLLFFLLAILMGFTCIIPKVWDFLRRGPCSVH